MIICYAQLCFIPVEGKNERLALRYVMRLRLFAVPIEMFPMYRILASSNMQVRVEILSI